jgi:fructose-1-phosphate kinase PfkB-like protein
VGVEGAVQACGKTPNTTACVLLLPSLNSAFEAALLRNGVAERHPPQIIYVMLFGIGLGGALLAGFGMGTSPQRSWVHMVTFAAAMSIALYVITDIEFPRAGLIRVDHFDHFLETLYNQIK